VLRQAASLVQVSQASSLGAEDMVITHLIAQHQLPIKVFVLQTGQLHPETLQLLNQVQSWPGLHLEVFEPNPTSVVEFVSREGQDAMYKTMALRKACCHIRKMEPLARALAGQLAWITGLRREQSDARAEVPDIDRSAQEADPTQALKFNPLADWTWGDVWHYIATEQVHYNPLHDQFYPSIGCAPCTRAISLGEDFRAGRWWWELESAKECGLHAL
jgi:phosphoadenosine phosphosulfate reductase